MMEPNATLPARSSRPDELCILCGLEKPSQGQLTCRACISVESDRLRCPRCHSPVESNLTEYCEICRLAQPESSWPCLPLEFEGTQLLSEISRGKASVVYLASASLDTNAGRYLAVKVATRWNDLDRSARSYEHDHRFSMSMSGLAQVVPVLRMDRSQHGVPFIFMELAGGPTLERVLADRGVPLQAQHAARLAMHMAGVLKDIHARGFIHLGLKPSNLFIQHAGRRDEQVRIASSRLACAVSQGDMQLDSSPLKDGLPLLPAPDFLSPEQLSHVDRSRLTPRSLSPAADVYSLGRLLYHMLSLKPPFDPPPRSLEQWIQAQREGTPTPLGGQGRDVPETLSRLVMDCLAYEPTRRPATVSELHSRLAAFLAEEEERLSLKRAKRGRVKEAPRSQTSMQPSGSLSLSALPVESASTGQSLQIPRPDRNIPNARSTASGRNLVIAGIAMLSIALLVVALLSLGGGKNNETLFGPGMLPDAMGPETGPLLPDEPGQTDPSRAGAGPRPVKPQAVRPLPGMRKPNRADPPDHAVHGAKTAASAVSASEDAKILFHFEVEPPTAKILRVVGIHQETIYCPNPKNCDIRLPVENEYTFLFEAMGYNPQTISIPRPKNNARVLTVALKRGNPGVPSPIPGKSAEHPDKTAERPATPGITSGQPDSKGLDKAKTKIIDRANW